MKENSNNDGLGVPGSEQPVGPSATSPQAITPSGLSASVPDATLAGERPKTIEQIRAGRRLDILQGKEPRTPEGDIFMFLEYVEKLIRYAKMREERKPYRTALMRGAEEAEIYLKTAYKACEELRTSNS